MPESAPPLHKESLFQPAEIPQNILSVQRPVPHFSRSIGGMCMGRGRVCHATRYRYMGVGLGIPVGRQVMNQRYTHDAVQRMHAGAGTWARAGAEAGPLVAGTLLVEWLVQSGGRLEAGLVRRAPLSGLTTALPVRWSWFRLQYRYWYTSIKEIRNFGPGFLPPLIPPWVDMLENYCKFGL